MRDDGKAWKHLEKGIKERMPLKLIEWNNPVVSTTNSSFINSIHPIFIPHDHSFFDYPNFPINWFKKPYLFLYIINCDDVGTYKKVVREETKNWVNSMKENQWIIIYVSANKKKNNFGLIYSVFDKIKSEFNERNKTPFDR